VRAETITLDPTSGAGERNEMSNRSFFDMMAAAWVEDV
jgi:hypothetical protein